MAAPPGALTLIAPAPREGLDWPVIVEGAGPGEVVSVYASDQGTGAGPCFVGGACLDLVVPVLIGQAVADGAGAAALSLPWPGALGGTVGVQAAASTTDDTSTVGVYDVVPAGGDGDGDGLPDVDEAGFGLDPFAADTDGDGLDDGVEVSAGTNPVSADTDGDGLDDGEEVGLHGTDPRVGDTDGDGALDGHEVRLGLDPLASDTDGDGLLDDIDFWPLQPGPFDPFVADDVVVSDPADSLPDPEFDPTGLQFTWQTDDGAELWVGHLDPVTGAFLPPDGRAEWIDGDVSPISAGRNGPEWVVTERGAEVVYARPTGSTHQVMHAWRDGVDWVRKPVVGAEGFVGPIGSLEPGDVDPRVRFRSEGPGSAPGDPYDLAFVDLFGSGVVEVMPLALGSARWVPGERAMVGARTVGDREQVFQYDLDTQAYTQLTDDGLDHGKVYMLEMPERGGEMVMLNTTGESPDEPTRLVVYEQTLSGWTEWYGFDLPAGFPYVVSPEPFTWRGRSYVSFLASTGALNRDNGEAQVWIAALDPARPLFRRVSLDVDAIRKDPEPHTAGARPWVYYARIQNDGDRIMRRCDLGL